MYPVGFVSLENPDTQALLISEDAQKNMFWNKEFS